VHLVLRRGLLWISAEGDHAAEVEEGRCHARVGGEHVHGEEAFDSLEGGGRVGALLNQEVFDFRILHEGFETDKLCGGRAKCEKHNPVRV